MVKKRTMALWLLVLSVAAAMPLLCGCKRPFSLKSKWTDKEITVDGLDKEWRDGGMYYDEKTNAKIGFMNDYSYLYVCLVSKNETVQRQILEGGFILWVCKDKKKNKLWGLRYPVGGEMPAVMGGWDAGGRPEQAGSREPHRAPEDVPSGGERGRAGEPEGQDSLFFSPQKEFELLDSEDGSGRIMGPSEIENLGIAGGFSQSREGGFVYEVKIPLKKNDVSPYAALPSKNGAILIGLLTETSSGSGMGDGGIGGGSRAGGGMGGGMTGGMGGGFVEDRMGTDGGLDDGGMGRGGMGGGGLSRSGMGRGVSSSTFELWSFIELGAAP